MCGVASKFSKEKEFFWQNIAVVIVNYSAEQMTSCF